MIMDEYDDLTSQLDAREILRYLNYLGIYNISGEVLKYFITDLKKLIKYDLQQRSETEEKCKGPERLHSASTFSSRSRSKVFSGENLCCNKDCQRPRRPLIVRNVHSAPTLGQKIEEKPPRRACSCIKLEKPKIVVKETKTKTYCENIIKVPKSQPKKKCDPVSLYHYYSSLWEKYKPNVPGENDWAELRWRIRQKMVGIDSQRSSKASVHKELGKMKKKTSTL